MNEEARSPDEGDPRGRWRALVVLAAAMVLGMTTWFSAAAVLPQLVAIWSLSSGEAAWLTIAVQLGFVAGGLVSAAVGLADVVAPRRLMLLGAAGAAAANALPRRPCTDPFGRRAGMGILGGR